MESAFTALCDAVVPDVLAGALQTFASHTGLKWGVVSANQYWFQPPKVHIGLFVLGMIFCAVLQKRSRGFRGGAIAQLAVKGAGRSVRCPINTLVAATLIVCLGAQVYVKGSRPKPLVQLAWLLMPCHVFTAVWIYIFLHDTPRSYANNCYLATLMMDWSWAPVAAALEPDWGDHRFFWEGYIFFTHHTLLLLLPVYYAARYDSLGLSWPHVFHLTWVPTFVNFSIFAPYGLFIGLNVNYQLAPPPISGPVPAALRSVLFRPAYVLIFVALSVLSNALTRQGGKVLRTALTAVQRAERKVK
ncbi:hypothetical protein ABB37_08733 [Leptomonas pyrrhocoris]|uniref:Uncharacterized protein n=1 Tax=Leptomonas pyrrhocoris TaxID=157538 RepID=A0A0N0DRW7_LEPPY|nr:hypothetical protein ABB37_08733 [Leptomonas pyrrhocoris]XP_015653487.1 hypothetical protein ABB37_08733 [Leptomonas pyrrhocoris]KPA75047.1 hypothetical protein ABB37_08733 [Leptomonas pyrrhocoris]KPA75048.1 hypothetical protein ABB37_08733 [Leptomonas pyrrhocoris]|eukprot:XP_015653486.1 hypothetical protein ABB37_08733 [Leptomonas pyrrhocoris]